MTALGELTFDGVLEQLEAPAPALAGASAAALVAAMAASLVVMVARGTRRWPDGQAVADRAARLRERLVELSEADGRAVAGLLDISREPPAVDRADKLALALLAASKPPVEIADAAAEIVELAADAAANGTRVMQADAAAAAVLARAATSSAVLIVKTNLSAMAVDPAITESSELLRRAGAAAERAKIAERFEIAR